MKTNSCIQGFSYPGQEFRQIFFHWQDSFCYNMKRFTCWMTFYSALVFQYNFIGFFPYPLLYTDCAICNKGKFIWKLKAGIKLTLTASFLWSCYQILCSETISTEIKSFFVLAPCSFTLRHRILKATLGEGIGEGRSAVHPFVNIYEFSPYEMGLILWALEVLSEKQRPW